MHKVFISYHHRNDQAYKNHLINLNNWFKMFIDKSVNTGDIPDHWSPQSIRRKIRDDYLQDSTVTILLLGSETRYRKHIDWELKSSMINGMKNKRSGILVITLPDIECNYWHTSHPGEAEYIYPEFHGWNYNRGTKLYYHGCYPKMPTRIIDNLVKPSVKISVVPWSKIESSPENLRFLISATSDSRHSNDYDLTEPMRMRDHNPNYLGV